MMRMKIQHPKLLVLLVLSYGISILWGYSAVWKKPEALLDFQGVYYGTRCLLHGCRIPTIGTNYMLSIRRRRSSSVAAATLKVQTVTLVFKISRRHSLFVTPFAILPWVWASLLWRWALGVVFGLAAYLIWKLAATNSVSVSTFLSWAILVNCEIMAAAGNAAGVVISACAIEVWCFVHKRFEPIGVLCLALSLVIKPHDSGFVWLYFLLAGGRYQRRALQALALTFVLGVFALGWVSYAIPHWWPELRENLKAISAPGSLNDQGPTSPTAHAITGVIDLETAIRVFSDDRGIYRTVTYLVCGVFLAIWSFVTARSRPSPPMTWIALAAVVPLTMLVTYHRPHDAKLLLLAIPACAMLWAEGGVTGRLAFVVTAAGILLTGDIPLSILHGGGGKSFKVRRPESISDKLTLFFMRPASCALLLMAIFYLWIYVSRFTGSFETEESSNLISYNPNSEQDILAG